MKAIIISETNFELLFENFLQQMEIESNKAHENAPRGCVYHRTLHYKAIELKEKLEESK